MAFLNDSQVQKVKEHMIAEDAVMLNSKFKSKNTQYDFLTIDLNQISDYEKEGWEVCGVNGNTQYPNPTIYFKKPYEESDKKSSK